MRTSACLFFNPGCNREGSINGTQPLKTYSDAVAFLYNLQYRGMKFGLRGIRGLLRDVGDPHQRFPSVHIAGSNGKGSTAAMIAAMLRASGRRVGLYTSPHLVDFRERVGVNGKPIPQWAVLALVRKLRTFIEKRNVTFFEATTALAFLYFAKSRVDIAVIETGLGGRLDATNVVKPLVSVLTTISLEHTQILGNSISRIAYEKAGIIKQRVPCVTGVRGGPALRVIRSTCKQRQSELTEVGTIRYTVHSWHQDRSVASFDAGGIQLKNLLVGLPGTFQVRNAVAAVAAVRLLGKIGFPVSEKQIRRGLKFVRRLSGLQARLSVQGTRPRMIMDVAHNPEAVSALVGALTELDVRDVILVFGVMRDKKVRPMLHLLSPITREAIAVQPGTTRSMPARGLEEILRKMRIPARSFTTVREGLREARASAGKGGTVLVMGSHFVVGEALAVLGRKKYLTINQ
ncbi:MAG TPA: folylpolyglutamate synthase/dihydrofolate synthase family protein [Bacteroidota bacterium]